MSMTEHVDVDGRTRVSAGEPEARRLRREFFDDEVLDKLIGASGERGVALTGEGGFLPEMIKAVLERGMKAELTDHLGYQAGDATITIAAGGDPEAFKTGGYATLPGWSYHNQWWVSHNADGAYMARGVHGQACYVDPKAEMAIVRFASHPQSSNVYLDPLSLPAYHALARHLMGATR